jgi:LacI family transcriptional regulator
MKDIAQLAGVSRGTVDRVLNNRGSVNADTEKRIRDIAKTLKYSPNFAGKTLAVRKKKLKFGYILFGTEDSNSFFVDVVYGIKSRATELLEFGVTVEIRYVHIHYPEQQAKTID